jgi:phosphoribosylaminoimidazole carboxylase (NCAIR synthetase)
MNAFSSNFKLGILGGGQLGRMLIQSAIDFNLYVKFWMLIYMRLANPLPMSLSMDL